MVKGLRLEIVKDMPHVLVTVDGMLYEIMKCCVVEVLDGVGVYVSLMGKDLLFSILSTKIQDTS